MRVTVSQPYWMAANVDSNCTQIAPAARAAVGIPDMCAKARICSSKMNQPEKNAAHDGTTMPPKTKQTQLVYGDYFKKRPGRPKGPALGFFPPGGSSAEIHQIPNPSKN